MQNEAGDRAGCFMNNYDRPRQMYDFAYIDEHYEEMRTLLTEARNKAKTKKRELILCLHAATFWDFPAYIIGIIKTGRKRAVLCTWRDTTTCITISRIII